MNTAVNLLPFALGLALSPIPIIELILVLFSKKRVLNSAVFVISLVVFSIVGLAMGAAGTDATSSDSGAGPSTVTAVVYVLLGALLLAIGLKNYRNRADTSEPAVLGTIAGMGPGPVAFLALGATIVNPKNLPLLLGAGSVIADTGSVVGWGLGSSSWPWRRTGRRLSTRAWAEPAPRCALTRCAPGSSSATA